MELFYLENGGSTPVLIGGLEEERLVIQNRAGNTTTRMKIEAQEDADVRRRCESSTDDGKSWRRTHDHAYRKQ